MFFSNGLRGLMNNKEVAGRFRGFLPVVVDVETAGFNSETDALLEVAAVFLDLDKVRGWYPFHTISCHIKRTNSITP